MRERIRKLLDAAEAGQKVEITGWVKSKRVSKNFAFLVVNDGSQQADLQIIVDAGTQPFEVMGDANTGAAIRCHGEIRSSPGKGQKWEVLATSLDIVGSCSDDYPLQKKGHTLEFLREKAHLRGRTNTFGAVFRVRNELARLVHEFFQSRDFIWAHTPLITANDCEGAGDLFQVTSLKLDDLPKTEGGKIDYSKDFFGTESHLAVSGQLNGESLAQCFKDIYTFGPTFRAENSNTSRHLAEFWMIGPCCP